MGNIYIFPKYHQKFSYNCGKMQGLIKIYIYLLSHLESYNIEMIENKILYFFHNYNQAF